MYSNNDILSLLKYARETAKNDAKIYEYLIKAMDDKLTQGEYLKKAEDEIIARKDTVFAFRFAKAIKNANIKALQQVIIDKKDAFYALCFARDIKGADILALEQVIIDKKDANYANTFATYVKGADLAPLYKIILDSKDEKLINSFEKNHKDFISSLENEENDLQ